MSYESYILLDMKLLVILERVALWVRTLRRKVWDRDAFFFFFKVSAVGGGDFSQPELLTGEVDK